MNCINHAREKVDSVLEILSSVRAIDYPYDDPKHSIDLITDHFEETLDYLDSTVEESAARNLCKQVSEDIGLYLPIIGFIVHACDIRGALELQGPLLRLTHLAIGSDARLIISSEWDYSPFTLIYPSESTFGRTFVLVGLPISEAGNPLIAPTAGHELGHNIWATQSSIADDLDKSIKEKVEQLIKGEMWKQFSSTFELEDQSEVGQPDLFGEDDLRPWGIARARGLAQAQEIFCDLIGLSIFGEGYLFAFQYLVSPGGGLPDPGYPSLSHRVHALEIAAKKLDINVPDNFADQFDRSDKSSDPKERLLFELSDKAAFSIVDSIADHAIQFCNSHGLNARDDDDLDRICELFKNVVPASGAKSLANIINAAWRTHLNPINPWSSKYPITNQEPNKRTELIRELTLKSFEVFEIEQRQG